MRKNHKSNQRRLSSMLWSHLRLLQATYEFSKLNRGLHHLFRIANAVQRQRSPAQINEGHHWKKNAVYVECKLKRHGEDYTSFKMRAARLSSVSYGSRYTTLSTQNHTMIVFLIHGVNCWAWICVNSNKLQIYYNMILIQQKECKPALYKT